MIAVGSGSSVRLMGFNEDGNRTDIGLFNLQVCPYVKRIPLRMLKGKLWKREE